MLAAAALVLVPRLRTPRLVVALAALAAIAAAAVWDGALFARGYRPSYWHVAWREYLAHPLLGSSGGTFGEF